MHGRHVAHRDLKSANILVAQDGTVRLADMGQACLLTDNEDPVMETGTPGWASPEQRNGGLVTEKSDIFSLGVICVEVNLSERVHSFTGNFCFPLHLSCNMLLPG